MDDPTLLATIRALEDYTDLLQRLCFQADIDRQDFSSFRHQSNELRRILNALVAGDASVVTRACQLRDEYRWLTQ